MGGSKAPGCLILLLVVFCPPVGVPLLILWWLLG